MRHKRYVFSLTDSQVRRLDAYARHVDISRSEALRRLIDEKLPPVKPGATHNAPPAIKTVEMGWEDSTHTTPRAQIMNVQNELKEKYSRPAREILQAIDDEYRDRMREQKL